jgi:hypothetical protein
MASGCVLEGDARPGMGLSCSGLPKTAVLSVQGRMELHFSLKGAECQMHALKVTCLLSISVGIATVATCAGIALIGLSGIGKLHQ